MVRPLAPALRRGGASSVGVVGALVLLGLSGCSNPELEIVGCWHQVEWRYELDDTPGLWNDGVRFREYPDRQLVQHHAEWWRVEPRGRLTLSLPGGQVHQAHWRLKGRGHVITIRYPNDDKFEVYDIKELDEHELILQYDMGMEARGIASLRFERSPDGAACAPEASHDRTVAEQRPT